MLDKPLKVIFPELNSLQIGWIRELMKREYERGVKDSHDMYPIRTMTKEAIIAMGGIVSEPTTTQYTANVSEKTDDN